MNLQNIRTSESLVAYVARIRRLARVNAEVPLQIAVPGESLLAQRTFVWLLSSVSQLVCFKVFCPCELLVAFGATVFFLFLMKKHVVGQVTGPSESFLADWAFQGQISSMSQLVDFQSTRDFKFFGTKGTGKYLLSFLGSGCSPLPIW